MIMVYTQCDSAVAIFMSSVPKPSEYKNQGYVQSSGFSEHDDIVPGLMSLREPNYYEDFRYDIGHFKPSLPHSKD